jgi:Protein of unknown function (DUF2591)
MKIKTSELTDAAIDWAVAIADGLEVESIQTLRSGKKYINVWTICSLTGEREHSRQWNPSTDWAQAGYIIEREKLTIAYEHDRELWESDKVEEVDYERYVKEDGPTPLVAAMRCFVASKLGEDVDVPDELVHVHQVAHQADMSVADDSNPVEQAPAP